MTIIEPQSPPAHIVVDPTLRVYSDRQLAVANTWADHLKLKHQDRSGFIRHYLRSTSTTRCWCVVLDDGIDSEGGQVRRVIARFGHLIQYFDGKTIRSCTVTPQKRIPLSAPAPAAARRLVERLSFWHGPGLLTSFCKHARDIALCLSVDDLGKARDKHSIAPAGRNKRYYGTRNRFYLLQIGAALKHFCHHLDPELLYAIRSARCPAVEVYNWLAQGNAHRRLQALRSQPVLIPLLVMVESASWPTDEHLGPRPSPWPALDQYKPTPDADDFEELQGALLFGHVADAGLPLNEVLAWFFDVPHSRIRYLGQQRPFHVGSALTQFEREGRDSGWRAMLAAATLGNRRPQKKPQWQAFIGLWGKLPLQLQGQPIDFNRLLTGCPNDWDDPAWPGIAARISDIKELFGPLSRHMDALKNEAKKRLYLFVMRSTYHQIGRLVDDFHHALTVIRNQLENTLSAPCESDEKTPWHPLLIESSAIECPNGLQIVELTCPAHLWEEHRALHHCIDTYDYGAYSGHCRLVSVRQNGKSLASAEIILKAPKLSVPQRKQGISHLVTTQLRGFANAVPQTTSPEHQAYEWFWGQVKKKLIPVSIQWTDLTPTMARYRGDDWSRNESDKAIAQWIIQRLANV